MRLTAKPWHGVMLVFAILLSAGVLHAQSLGTSDPPFYGPFNGVFLPDGDGLRKTLSEHDSVLRADSPWSLYCWVRIEEDAKSPTLVAGVGDLNEEYPRYIGFDASKVMLWLGNDNALEGSAAVTPGKWHLLGATFDGGDFRFYSDGQQVANGKLALGTVSPLFQMAPPMLPWPNGQHFGGKIASLTLTREVLTTGQIKQIFEKHEDFSLAVFEEGSKPWRVQTRGQAGYRAPQDPATMPRSRAPIPAPPSSIYRQHSANDGTPSLETNGDNQWTIGAWRLSAAPEIHSTGEELSKTGVETKNWLPATVPGTVLTTMVDRGLYPDPDYGLNNLAI